MNVLGSPMGDQDDVPFGALIESEGDPRFWTTWCCGSCCSKFMRNGF